MTEHEKALARIETTLARLEERAAARAAEIATLKQEVHGLSKFRWVLLGGIGITGGASGLGAEMIKSLFQ
jgi:hypothetical protein